MQQKYHFISGLPRSGSTMLSAILRQNPQISSGMSSPILHILKAALVGMSTKNEYSIFVSDEQRRAISRSIFDTYYRDGRNRNIIFDTNRAWCAELSILADLFPDARVICCVRRPAWILDSIERQVRRNPLQPSQIFGSRMLDNVYARADVVMTDGKGLFGFAWNSLRQAWASEQASRLIFLRYETLVSQPKAVIDKIYSTLSIEPFDHDFDNLDYSEPGFDRQIGTAGLHDVAPRVMDQKRQTILPPDLFSKFDHAFWENAETNTRNVTVW
jgi:sulfotransferase